MKVLLLLGSVLGIFFQKNFTRPLKRLVNKRVDQLVDEHHPEDVWITAHDGLRLHGKLISGGELSVLLLHGHHSSAGRDFSTMIPYYIKKGYTILMPDFRSHGKSDGMMITFGKKESLDARQWIDYLIKEGTKNILIHGISMGAATTLLLRNLDLPKEVQLMIVDCPYLDAYDQIQYSSEKMGKAAKVLTPMLSSLLNFVGLDLKETSPWKALGKKNIPMLFIHGTADYFVPTKNSVRAYMDTDEVCELHLFKGAPHARSMKMYPKEYEELVDDFIKRHEKNS